MEKFNLQKEAAKYSNILAGFESATRLPIELFNQPDHIAIKTINTKEFDKFVNAVTPHSEEAYCIEDQNRWVVMAKLVGRVSLGFHGNVRWLEIKEPRPDAPLSGPLGVEHAEFMYSNFSQALNEVRRQGFDPDIQSEGHRRISLVFTQHGHEVKLTDTPLEEIVNEKLDDQEAYILKSAA